MNILIINLVLYILTTIFSHKKNGLTIATFLWIYYTIYAFLGIIVVATGIYESQINISTKHLTLAPYIINYICVFLLISPLNNIKKGKFDLNELKEYKKFKHIYKYILYAFIVYLCIRLYEFTLVSKMNFEERYSAMAGEGVELLKNNIFLQYTRKIFGLIYYSTFPFSLLYIISGLINRYLTQKQIILYILLTIMPLILSCVIAANRAELYLFVFRILFFILIFFHFLSKKHKRNLIKISLIGLISISTIALSISYSRYENQDQSPFSYILRYFGETYPNIGYVYWDNVKKHPMGKRMYPQIYYEINEDEKEVKNKGFFEKYTYWRDYTGVPVLYFKPLLVEMYIEFDIIIGFIIIFFLSFIIKKILNANAIFHFYNIPIAYIYFIICCHSVIGSPLSIKTFQISTGIILFSLYIKNKQKRYLK